MRRCGLVLLWTGWFAFLVALSQASASRQTDPLWEYHTCQGERIVLYYPSLLSAQDASAFLDSRDAAVQFVEGFLGVQLDQQVQVRIDVNLIATIGHASNPSWDRPLIVLGIPFHQLADPRVLRRPEVSCHEEAHIVAKYAWVTTTRNPALDEGLAVAIDFRYRLHSTYDPHLIAKGLDLLGRLPPLGELFTLPLLYAPDATDTLSIYMGCGSFFLFLLDAFDLDAIAAFFRLSAPEPRAPLPALFREVFGAELCEVEQGWHQYLGGYSSTQELRAIRAVQAFTEVSVRVTPLVEKLERYWTEFPFQLLGPSEMIAEKYQSLMRLLQSLGGYRAEKLSAGQLDSIFEDFQRAQEDVETHLAVWLNAIKFLTEGLDSLSLAMEADYGWRINKLKEASQSYASAGDNYLAERTRALLQALCFSQEGRDALSRGEMERAESAFLQARERMLESSYPGMMFEIGQLLMASKELTW